MKILLTGKTGQVGYELERSLQGLGEIIAVDRTQMDLSNLDQIRNVIRTVKPDLIVNPAAYTAVDKAESEPELAMLINGIAPGVIAEEAKKIGAGIIHYSTDYVFDGGKRGAQGEFVPYTEEDVPNPINVYGKTKLAGEQAIIASGCPHLILRTSWVYSTYGKNFLLTMLRLGNERDELKIVDDQWGSPTWSGWIADTTAQLIKEKLVSSDAAGDRAERFAAINGIYNFVNSGYVTWCGFARGIFANAALDGRLLKKSAPIVYSISTLDYPVPAERPLNSELSTQKLQMILNVPVSSWSESLQECLARESAFNK
ncbi:dTDP-4-dehydrorhamnose reductase [Glaciimonas immobilis]|uniref:dTDP-4-dehydrorhamnose reductase n=1 Tax=Glaciimonas immobilis TaxID=728004 RepID=A0A840RSU6_9BURK|nr:dTDP-4-dehydrorhamnose reductase [Glaciimonas immobilis]KAF3997444.1 dTDP-4-dehydrorhamnose reductase [Glaciimonas immobilis]MBB5200885.1 dTDP-4-dehydrorhamnose reductase [Glaciimonas immobilis]